MSADIDTKLQKMKEDILKEIRNSENKTLDAHLQLKKEFEDRLLAYEQFLEENKARFESLQDNNAEYKVKILENFPNLLNNVKINSEEIFSLNIKLTSMQKEMNDGFKKYDKVILDNLVIPGTIGEFCQYKNLRDYIENNILNISDLKKYKEKSTIDFNSYKEHLDKMIRQFNFQIESHDNNFKDFSKKTLAKFEQMSKVSYNEFADKIEEVKIENGKYNLELSKRNKEMKEKIEELEKMKDTLSAFWDEELEKLKKYHNTHSDEISRDLAELKRKLLDVTKSSNDNIALSKDTNMTLNKIRENIKNDLHIITNQINENTISIENMYINLRNLSSNSVGKDNSVYNRDYLRTHTGVIKPSDVQTFKENILNELNKRDEQKFKRGESRHFTTESNGKITTKANERKIRIKNLNELRINTDDEINNTDEGGEKPKIVKKESSKIFSFDDKSSITPKESKNLGFINLTEDDQVLSQKINVRSSANLSKTAKLQSYTKQPSLTPSVAETKKSLKIMKSIKDSEKGNFPVISDPKNQTKQKTPLMSIVTYNNPTSQSSNPQKKNSEYKSII